MGVVVHAVVAVEDDDSDDHHGTGWPVVAGLVVVADGRFLPQPP